MCDIYRVSTKNKHLSVFVTALRTILSDFKQTNDGCIKQMFDYASLLVVISALKKHKWDFVLIGMEMEETLFDVMSIDDDFKSASHIEKAKWIIREIFSHNTECDTQDFDYIGGYAKKGDKYVRLIDDDLICYHELCNDSQSYPLKLILHDFLNDGLFTTIVVSKEKMRDFIVCDDELKLIVLSFLECGFDGSEILKFITIDEVTNEQTFVDTKQWAKFQQRLIYDVLESTNVVFGSHDLTGRKIKASN